MGTNTTDLAKLQDVARALFQSSDLQSLVDQIVTSGKELLECPAGVLWLVDHPGRHLYAAGVAGLDDHTKESLRDLPLEGSLEGKALGHRELVIGQLDEVRCQEYGPLCKAGFRQALSLPLNEGSSVLGVVTFLRRDGTYFEPADTQLADYYTTSAAIALAGQKRRAAEQQVARILRDALIPTDIPEVPGLDVAIHGKMADEHSEVGGDFVDVFEADSAFCIACGDIAGKGPDAASFGVMAKYMLRAIAFRNPSPASVLFHLNRALCQTFQQERFLTLSYALFEPATRKLLVANGGSWPPMLLTEGKAEPLAHSGGLLGAFEDAQYPQVEVELGRGGILLAYTDGIVEARRGKEMFGEDCVRHVLEQHAEEPAQGVARGVFESARGFSGGLLVDDAVVVVLKGE